MDDLNPLLDKAVEILRRDINNLFAEASTKALHPQRASSLVAYIKVLRDILKDDRETEEELQERVKEILGKIGTGPAAGAK